MKLIIFFFLAAAEAAKPDSPVPELQRLSSGSPIAGPSGAQPRVQEPPTSDVAEEQGLISSDDGEVWVILQSRRGQPRRPVLPRRALGRTSSIEASTKGQKRKHGDSPQVVAIHSATALDEVSKKRKKNNNNYLFYNGSCDYYY